MDFLVADSFAEAVRLATGRPVSLVATGRGLTPVQARELIEALTFDDLPSQPATIVLAGGANLQIFQDLIDRDHLFYLAQEPPPAEDVLALLRSGVRHRPAGRPAGAGEESGERERARRLLAAVQAVTAQTQPSGAARTLADGACDLVGAVRTYTLLYDTGLDTLWEEGTIGSAARRESASVGLVSFVLRTGRPVAVERIGEDPRLDRDADDPEAVGNERFAAVPIGAGGDGSRQGVLVAVRAADQPPFSAEDMKLLASLGEQVAPTFRQLLLAKTEPVAEELYGIGLFRTEALEHSQRGLEGEGDLLRLDPAWMRWTYRLLVAGLCGGILFISLARVREYAAGPAVIRLGDRTEVTATTDGIVSQVPVAPGEKVAAGQILVRFHNAREAADLERIEGEFELHLINRLRDPSDAGAANALIGLRTQRDLARSRLAELEVRSPGAGQVSDVRVRPGQRIASGQSLVSVLSGGAGDAPQLIALLPGQYRPMLKSGQPLRLELNGYRYSYQHLEVQEIGDDVIGPAEARRLLGEPIADAVALTGPVVPVTLKLPSGSFVADGQRRAYHDGMWGTAEVRVRSEPALVALVPALKVFFEDADAVPTPPTAPMAPKNPAPTPQEESRLPGTEGAHG
jgi:membrane fusion protein (multidrug efflux system)